MTDQSRTVAEVASIDEWCQRQCEKLTEPMSEYIMRGGATADPQYRQQFGQYQAFMRMRSYLHGVSAHLEQST